MGYLKSYIGLEVRVAFTIIGIGDVEAKAQITSTANDGIGSYEYWGCKGFDRGRDYVEEFELSDITVDGKVPDEDTKYLVEETAAEDETISNMICEKLEMAAADREEDEDEHEREDR
jgi:hypothetical protein